jgi:hypothetical protein
MRLNPRKLHLRKPEMIPIHPCFLPEAVNHNETTKPTTLWVRTLIFFITKPNLEIDMEILFKMLCNLFNNLKRLVPIY